MSGKDKSGQLHNIQEHTTMTITAIIQSRMTSQRYPGKMLAPFLGKPVLAHVVDRIKKTQVNPSLILATSDDQADDPLAVYGQYLGLNVIRGPRDDVMGRFALALTQHKCEAFFRVCGDSPLLLSFLFDQATALYKSCSYDLVTNVFPRTFPVGMSFELIRTKTFLEMEKSIVDKEDREHLTKYFYRRPEKFKIYNIECAEPADTDLKLALDELEDLKRLETWFLAKGANYEDLFPVLSVEQPGK